MKIPLFKGKSKIDLSKPLLPEEIKKLDSKQKKELLNKGIASTFNIKTLTGDAILSKRRQPSRHSSSQPTIDKLRKDVKSTIEKTKLTDDFLTHELDKLYNLI